MRYLISAMIVFSNFAYSDSAFPIGNWEAYSRSDSAIYGSFTFTKDKVYWGLSPDAPPCSANYSVEGAGVETWNIMFANKQCKYDEMKNSTHSRKIVGINLRIDPSLNSKYDKRSKKAWVSTMSEGWKANGSGVYQHYKSSFYENIKI